jgi:class 3 adenylate cyclase/CHASE2 domain-containing sensor protein
MAEARKSDSKLQPYLGPIVGILVLLFAVSKAYERAELVSYDWRFNIRNSIFGLPAMDSRLGTIEIDDQTLQVEGRWQDWTRTEYVDVVRILGEYQAELVGFDIYFIEPKTKLVSEKQIRALKTIDENQIEGLLAKADYDQRFHDAIKQAGNVYLAQYLIPVAEHAEGPVQIRPTNADQQQVLAHIRNHSPKLMVPAAESTIDRGTHFEPPLKLLRDAALGFANAQTTEDFDGSRRRYPLVFQYEDVLFPSIALSMVCHHLQIPIEHVEVWPGDHIRLPNAKIREGLVKDIEIPIDDYGTMNVNWAGKWEETFVRYPHLALRRAAQREDRQRLLEKIKQLVAANPGLRRNLRGLPALLAKEGFEDVQAARSTIGTWMQASGIEAAVRREPGLEATQFWLSKGVKDPQSAQLNLYRQIQRNNRVAAQLAEKTDIDLTGLGKALPDYEIDDLRQSLYYLQSNLVEGTLSSSARPLYFYPYPIAQGNLVTPDEIRGKILFYGQTSTGSTDLSVMPFQGNYPMVGIYSNVFNTILQEQFIRRTPLWSRIVLVLVLGLAMSLIVPKLKVLQGAVLIAVLATLYAVVALGSFTHLGLWLEVIGPMTTIIVGYLVLTIYGYIIKEREKDFVQGAFGHYLSPTVIEQIMANPEMVNQLGGEERVMTAFFSDIASFSTISECLTPGELVDFINGYLTEMCDIIEGYGGTIDKFEGDAIVAFFGAPIYFEDHAIRAVMSCIDQQRKLIELRQRWNEPGAIPAPLEGLRDRWQAEGRTFGQVRIGATTGPMIVGNMGSRSRTDYTMMGDTVNLAARFESGQKVYGTNIMVNDIIFDQVKDLVESRKLDLIQVVGKEEPVTAYEILERKGDLNAEMMQVLELYNEGLLAYWAFKFAEAKKLFDQALIIVPSDGPSALYADRCEDFSINPPEDLVFRADSK